MPQSLARIYIHVVFSTKNRVPILDKSIREELFAYITGVLDQMDCPSIQTGGYTDHIHVLLRLHRQQSIANVVETIKVSTTKWIKTKGRSYAAFRWQSGYGAFSVNYQTVNAVKSYIQNQEVHHAQQDFQDEFRKIAVQTGLEIDEQYVWD